MKRQCLLILILALVSTFGASAQDDGSGSGGVVIAGDVFSSNPPATMSDTGDVFSTCLAGEGTSLALAVVIQVRTIPRRIPEAIGAFRGPRST